MSANLESTTSGNGGVKSWLHRPPYIGLVAFLIVFVVQALGHTVMIMMEEISVLFGMIGPHLRKTLGVIASTRLGARGISADFAMQLVVGFCTSAAAIWLCRAIWSQMRGAKPHSIWRKRQGWPYVAQIRTGSAA